ncbi:RHS repeat domain-containing protein [Silvibacterium acidisoli]|uniref:RHS repeat domain-containing protein n=1 Tax=Acidobacteriaceae bacterium ZG23-2 TaxID=2883246 RepID=UPI00406CFCA9
MKLRAAVWLMLVLSARVVLGQALGTYSFGTFDNKNFDTINLGNLNVIFSIPVLNKAGRAGTNFTYSLTYNGMIWTPGIVNGVTEWVPAQNWGWQGETEALTGYISETQYSGTCVTSKGKFPYHGIRNLVYHNPFGVAYPISGYVQTSGGLCTGDADTFGRNGQYSVQSGGYPVVETNGTVINAPVNTTTGASTFTDQNGNELSVDDSGNFTDTSGRVVLTTSGGSPNPEVLSYWDTTGTKRNITMSYKSYTVQTSFGCSSVSDVNLPNTYLVDSISFPDGSAFHFSYEQTPGSSSSVTGRLASITLRTGGVISYTYSGSNNGIVCADGTTVGLTRNLTNDPANSSWSYTRTPNGGSSATSVKDGLGNQANYTFVQATGTSQGQYYETSRTVYKGSTGTPILSRQTCYNGSAQPCTTTGFNLPVSQVDTYSSYNGVAEDGSTSKYNVYGLRTEEDDYDFGTSSRGSLLRKVVWTYPTTGNVALLQTKLITDGSGTTVSDINYKYDGSTPTPTSGVPQHISVSGQRGNLTTLSGSADASTAYPTIYTYDDTGTVTSAASDTSTTLPTTSYSYDPAKIYTTGTTLPTPSSGIALSTSKTYDQTYTGLPLTSTDLNGQVTVYKSYDNMLRPLEIDHPDGGKIVYSYSSPNQTDVQTYMNATTAGDTRTILDAYGRKSVTEVEADGNNWYEVSYCYDANGNLQFQSYPALNQSGCGLPGDTFSYDSLGRLTSVAHSDGTSSSTQYLGKSVEQTDESAVVKIAGVDGLGRSKTICEVSSNTSTIGSSARVSCGLDLPGTGYLTNFTYSGDQTTVVQGSQTRVFKSDWIGRPVSVQEPESGTTTYSYALNSTGLLVARTKPRANQTSSAVTTTTSMQYDLLGRLLSASYNDNLTSTRSFTYDAACCWANAASATNLKGRLATTGAGLGSANNAATLLSYDSMGRVTELWQCTPASCGNSGLMASRPITMTYDWAGNLLREYDLVSGAISYGRSRAGEVTSISQGTYANSFNPAVVVSNVVNGPNGPTSYSLGNGLEVGKTYDSMGRPNGSYTCVGSTAANCSGGSRYVFGNYIVYMGNQVVADCDIIAYASDGNCIWPHYDDMGRMTTATNNSGPVVYTWTYDQYGNRWSQTGPSSFSASFDATSNRLNSSPYTYDAVGNLTYDGQHHYTYDGEGNVVDVDLNQGNTASYVYNAWNQRVVDQESSGSYEYLYDPTGLRTSDWETANDAGVAGKIYWDGQQIAFRDIDGTTYFDHADYLGRQRVRTNYQGATAAEYISGPFGDNYSASLPMPSSDQDNLHFAGLDQDAETMTEHATFRQYSPAQGRWMSPDPYGGSYDMSAPQSFNRYAYVQNDPFSGNDPSGLVRPPSIGDLMAIYRSGSLYSALIGNFGGDEFSQSTTVCAGAGCYSYSTSSWNIMMSDGYGGGVIDDPSGNGDLDCGDGSICGTLFTSFSGGAMPDFVGTQTTIGSNSVAPSNATPWYHNTCITGALKSGALHVGIDSIGLIPEAGGIARIIGHQAGYRGIVADQLGAKVIARVGLMAGYVSGVAGVDDTSATGLVSSGLSVAGIVSTLAGSAPIVGQVISGLSIADDLISTGMAVASCKTN